VDKPDVERTITFPRWQMPTPAIEVEDICCYLVMIEGGEPGRRIPIGAKPITVGRDPNRDVVLADTDVSRLHLEILLTQGQVTVVE
jgi:hypothetical protein